MAVTRRGFLGAAAVIGTAGTAAIPVNGETVLLAPELRDGLWTSYYSNTRVWGYANKHSVRPGEPFDVMMSVGPGVKAVTGIIEIFRIGPCDGGDRKLIVRFDGVDVAQEKVKITSAALGTGWPAAVDMIDTTGWESGYYTIDFVDAADKNRDLNVASIVVLPSVDDVDVLVLLSTNTYQAYNAWGGYSFYESIFAGDWGQMISFDRPTPPDFFGQEYFLVQWLEQMGSKYGWRIGYATNFDIHRDKTFVESCRLLVSGCHNEYWSKEEFDHVYGRIFVQGKNTIFFGANSAYWQVRYADLDRPDGMESRGRHLICFKSMTDPIGGRVEADEARLLKTAKFRDDARRSETMLAGVAYQSYFDASSLANYPYQVSTTDLPFFKGTGYNVGDTIGDVVGYEWDNRDPEGDGNKLWDAAKSRIPKLDEARLQVLFTGTPVDLNGKTGKAEAVYFISEAGAHVFSTGTIRWAWGLGKPGFEREQFKRFNENLFRYFLDV